MKVAELKQVVDANAVEMREGFGEVRANFAEVYARFDRLERRIDEQGVEMSHRLGVIIEEFTGKIAMVVEDALEKKIDLKIAKLEVRLERKFDRKSMKR